MKNRIAIFTISLLAIPAVLFAAWGRGGGPCFNDGYWAGGPGSGWFETNFFGGGLFMMLITIILLGFLIFFAIKYFKNSGESLKKENPLDILKMRYAKSEISKETFESMKKDLESVK